jgi:NAD(P)-dependent dehydrogenase (short-subunit alcohol dehydrogenase family)
LHDLADRFQDRLEVETLDICEQSQVEALRQRLSSRIFDMLFVNAGTTTHEEMVTIGDVTTDEFVRVMVTNALCPMRVVDSLQDLVSAEGLVGVMSSGQGSVANNVTGMRDVYRCSKAALNQLMRSYAARQTETSRAMVLMAPGWVRTELGGSDAPLSIEDSVPNLVNVLLRKQGTAGLEYLDYLACLIHIFEDNKGLLCYKHVVKTMFAATKEASECLKIAQHSVCCSQEFFASLS